MEEFEILDFHELQQEQEGIDKTARFLQKKIQNGFKVSIVIKKQHKFGLAPLQQKKNDLFSKQHKPMDIISQSSEQTENNDKQGSSTSSHSSIKMKNKLTIPPTQNETPEQNQDEQRTEKSDDDQISLYSNQINNFEHLLKDNLLSQKIQIGLSFMRDGNSKMALEKMMDAYKEGNEKLKQCQDQQQISVLIIICIQSLCYASQLLMEFGQFSESQKCLDKCLNQFEINDFDLKCKIYIAKAQCNLSNNQYLQCLDNYTKALIQYEQVNWKLEVAKLLIKISFVYALLNDFADAKKICYEGLSILQTKLSNSDPKIYDAYYTLGCIYYLEKEYDFALEYLDQSKEGFIKLYGEKDLTIIKILNLQGVINHLQGNSINAMELYEQIVCLYGDSQNIGLALVLNNLALVYLDRMKFKSAKLSFEKSIAILKGYINEQHPTFQRIEKNKKLVVAATLSYL
ncbi:unnamed protein product (macronuclear) [Paramecium tetraurelia]|uniref:MalT-like TPR region domain-containing protein n=1 Tax=Paramecium tetraurelia TaxID=5888 RepID=A0EE05_PARTE|nr:uncharacterized protein GSPATT00025866001 [Paramecium tetraurelia]CAK93522.1 unnamed protein product [Paramecium tetraurelia]|eukprot:XP_001460919.1 hypothetical protein (macronuclear) [Paramecium tetraurelia strain d4-2]